MKKYLYSALALPLLFACSSEDFSEKSVISSDQFAGIEKVDATFSMDEGTTRFDGNNGADPIWKAQEGDLWGFAWLGDGTKINPATDGIAYQNHNLIQTDGIFKPQTSIYIGKYYLYRPYDETTVSPQAINFKSLEEQTLAEGYASSTQAWKNLAKTAINIADKWNDVTVDGVADATVDWNWNKAGIDQHYKLYPALFSNQTGLDLTYVNNNPSFAAATAISGATDIILTYAAGEPVGDAHIYGVTVDLEGSAKSFTYAPKAEPNGADHSGEFWADKDGTADVTAAKGFDFTDDVITLTPADAENGISTGTEGSTAWFWFNSLPVTAGDGALATTIQTVFNTSYGIVTVNKTVQNCAYEFAKYNNAATSKEWIKLSNADANNVTPKTWNLAGAHTTFVNQYGNHKGKYKFDVDFSDGVMNGMDIKSDAHLQTLLKYYLASGKNEVATLNLVSTTGEFKLSKISIALLQTINRTADKVFVNPSTLKIIVTQEGQTTDNGLADKKEVPALNKVFSAATNVYLSSEYDWTWSGNYGVNNDGTDPLPVDANVTSIINEGTASTNLTVNATNVETSPSVTIENASGATMNITQVTTVKNHLRNLGTLNVGSESNTSAELRAYGKVIANQATALDAYGTINNYGVVGVTAGTSGVFRNFGLINMMNNDAITLLTANESGTNPFGSAFSVSPSNKMGTVVLPEGNPYALVSVSNGAETGFIKYNWTGATYTHDAGNVKYNTIVVSNDIEFTGGAATEIQYIEFNGNRTKVVNPAADDKLTSLKGIIVDNKDHNASIIIEKTNKVNCSVGAYLGTGATVYKGGVFTKNGAAFVAADATAANNYLGAWSLDQIVEY